MEIDLGRKRDQLRAALAARRAAVMRPTMRMAVDEWADRHRILPSETSAITGRWQTSAFEVARGPMRACTEPGVRQVTGMASAQIFKTSMIECAVGREMHLNPSPVLLFFAGDNAAKKFDTSKLEPMIKSTPELANLFGGPERLEKQNPAFASQRKTFPGGSLEVMTADSVPNLRMRTARLAALDEADAVNETADGDTLSLIRDRLKNYRPHELLIVTSTPTETGTSVVAAEYADSDQRRPYVACPGCGEWDYFRWESFIMPRDESGAFMPEEAHYLCTCCGHRWTDAERVLTVTTKGRISWRQTRPFSCCGETQDPDQTSSWRFVDDQTLEPVDGPGENVLGLAACRHCGSTPVPRRNAGFWAWELYNPRTSFQDLCALWAGTKGNPSKLRVFFNNVLARTFARSVESSKVVDPSHLASRAEPPFQGAPRSTVVITAGVDVQSQGEGRIEAEKVAWGPGDESWSLDYKIFEGDPASDEVWQTLDAWLREPVAGEDGRTHFVQAAAVDYGGHYSAQTASFCGLRQARRVWAVKGLNEPKTSPRAPIWPRKVSATKGGCPIYPIGTRLAKDVIERHLSASSPGPGYMHFPSNRSETWFKQLTAEHRVTITLPGGKAATYWDKRPGHQRNEALDCRVYATAALHGLRSLGLVANLAAGAAIPAATEASTPTPKKVKKPSRSNTTGGFGAPGW